jgi:hypothetical protein
MVDVSASSMVFGFATEKKPIAPADVFGAGQRWLSSPDTPDGRGQAGRGTNGDPRGKKRACPSVIGRSFRHEFDASRARFNET